MPIDKEKHTTEQNINILMWREKGIVLKKQPPSYFGKKCTDKKNKKENIFVLSMAPSVLCLHPSACKQPKPIQHPIFVITTGRRVILAY